MAQGFGSFCRHSQLGMTVGLVLRRELSSLPESTTQLPQPRGTKSAPSLEVLDL
jgi:hypothetical protein